jgi:enterochelin esterase-like enzyme
MDRSSAFVSMLIVAVPSGFSHPAVAQSKHAPQGFDHRHKGVAAGKAHTAEYDSKSVGARRKMIVYTPPGYSKSEKYPVLYLMHGFGGDHTDWTKEGDAATILDNLHAQKKIVSMIVVMPDNRISANPGAGKDKPQVSKDYGHFTKDLLSDLIPFVESHYPAIATRESRALAGLSMGGGDALNIGLAHLDTFAWIGAFSSPGIHKDSKLFRDPSAAAEKLRLLWISCGNKDPKAWEKNKQLHDDLLKLKVPHVWHVDAGEHVWPVWKNDLYWMSQRLFR